MATFDDVVLDMIEKNSGKVMQRLGADLADDIRSTLKAELKEYIQQVVKLQVHEVKVVARESAILEVMKQNAGTIILKGLHEILRERP